MSESDCESWVTNQSSDQPKYSQFVTKSRDNNIRPIFVSEYFVHCRLIGFVCYQRPRQATQYWAECNRKMLDWSARTWKLKLKTLFSQRNSLELFAITWHWTINKFGTPRVANRNCCPFSFLFKMRQIEYYPITELSVWIALSLYTNCLESVPVTMLQAYVVANSPLAKKRKYMLCVVGPYMQHVLYTTAKRDRYSGGTGMSKSAEYNVCRCLASIEHFISPSECKPEFTHRRLTLNFYHNSSFGRVLGQLQDSWFNCAIDCTQSKVVWNPTEIFYPLSLHRSRRFHLCYIQFHGHGGRLNELRYMCCMYMYVLISSCNSFRDFFLPSCLYFEFYGLLLLVWQITIWIESVWL